MGKEERFGNKKNSNGFDKNPENINRSGANRKSFGSFNKLCKERGVEPLSQTEYISTLSYLYQLTEVEIKELADDKEQPLALRLLIAELTDPQSRGKTLQELRDYLFHKGIIKIQQETTNKVDFTKEQIDKLIDKL
jgi:hypothetical protein